MASALYDLARQAFGEANIDWPGDDIRVILVDTGAYTVNLATHEFLSSIPGGARIAVSGTLTGCVCPLGIFDADDITITGVTGATVEALVIYQHTGVDATSRLIAYIDSYTGLVYTPSGANVTVVWPATTNRIFKL